MNKEAGANLGDAVKTTLVLVAKAERTPRLRDAAQADVVIVTLSEAIPVWEAQRLLEELLRAGIHNKWWVVNQCLCLTRTQDPMLQARTEAEEPWLEKVKEISGGINVSFAPRIDRRWEYLIKNEIQKKSQKNPPA